MTGASGAIYGVRLLRLLGPTEIETHLVLSKSAKMTLTQELDVNVSDVTALADVVHQADRNRHRRHFFAGYASRRCRAQGTPPAGTHGAGNATASGAFEVYGDSDRDRRHHLPAGPGVLR